jgi:putative ABC transport system permease protein
MTSWLIEIRRATRSLARSPGLAVVAVLTLALGIGANTALFSVVNGVLLRAMPYPDPDALVEVSHVRLDSGEEQVVSPGNYYDWRERVGSFESLAAYDWVSANLTGAGPARRIQGVQSAGSILEVLGVPPARGRIFTAGEDAPGAAAVVVLSASLATEVFGAGDPVGRDLVLDGAAFTVVGVMPAGFKFPRGSPAFWVPARFDPELRASRTEHFMRSIGRLADDATVVGSRAELATVMEALRSEYPEANGSLGAAVTPLKDDVVADVRGLIGLLMGTVAVVLLIACVNVANLLLARFSERRREVAVRKALGAGRWRIGREVGAEGLVLALAGGAAGLWLGGVLLDALLATLSLDLPRKEEISVDLRVLAFTTVAAVGTGLLAGVLPALRAVRQPPSLQLRARTDRGGGRTRRALVVFQVLLAVILLSGAMLLTRSVDRLMAVDPGYDAGGILAVDLDVPGSYDLPRRAAFYQELEARVEGTAGVEAASYATVLPLGSGGSAAWINLLDRPAPDGEPPWIDYRVVGTDFTEVLGIPLVRGRIPSPNVSRDGPAEVVIDEVVAARFWPGADPLGREITLGPDGGWIPPARIVGIVGAVRGASLAEPPPGFVYLPHALTPWWTGMTLVVRPVGGDPLALAPRVRSLVAELDPEVPVIGVGTVAERIRDSIADDRSMAALMGGLAGLAVVLAAVGLYGVLAYAVAARRRELGIRSALGASPAGVRRLVLGQGLGLVALGLAGGLLVAAGASRVLEPWLFQVSPRDPVSYALVGGLILAVAGVASWVPASRATRVDPAVALRAD